MKSRPINYNLRSTDQLAEQSEQATNDDQQEVQQASGTDDQVITHSESTNPFREHYENSGINSLLSQETGGEQDIENNHYQSLDSEGEIHTLEIEVQPNHDTNTAVTVTMATGVNLKKYDGTESIHLWISNLQNWMKFHNVTENAALFAVGCNFEGQAATWLETLAPSNKQDLHTLVECMKERFSPKETNFGLLNVKQGATESESDYLARAEKKCLGHDLPEPYKVQFIINGLKSTLKGKVMSKEPKTFQQLRHAVDLIKNELDCSAPEVDNSAICSLAAQLRDTLRADICAILPNPQNGGNSNKQWKNKGKRQFSNKGWQPQSQFANPQFSEHQQVQNMMPQNGPNMMPQNGSYMMPQGNGPNMVPQNGPNMVQQGHYSQNVVRQPCRGCGTPGLGYNTFLIMCLISCLCLVSASPDITIQRLNYGVLFEQTGNLYLGQEYWLHTFKIPLPKKVYLHGELRCNAPHCKYKQSIIKMLNALRTQSMANVNSTVHEIHSLVPMTIAQQPKSYVGSSRTKRGLFDFIGKISKSLFGTATSDDLATLQRHIQTLNSKNAKMAKAMAIQEKHLSSFISTVNERFDNMMSAVEQNHKDSVALSSLLQTSFDALEHEYVILETLIMKQTNASAKLKLALEHLKLGIHDLLKGKLSPFLMNTHEVKSSLNQVQRILDKKFPQFNIVHKDPLYYFSYGDFLYTRLHSFLYLTLKIPISPFKQPLRLFDVYTFPVPVNSSTSHATKLMDMPMYYAHTHDNQHFTTVSPQQLSKCRGTSSKICSFHLTLTSSASPSCISAIFYNQKDMVHKFCDFRFITNEIKPAIIEVSSLNTLMYQISMVALDCPKGQRMIKGCNFCVMQLPCLCSVTSGDLYLPPKIGSCSNNSDSVTVLHPVNLAVIQEFFDYNSHNTIYGDTYFQQYLDLSIPHFQIFNHSFSKYLAADQTHHLSLKKMAKLAKKDATVFKSLAESMIAGQIDFSIESFPNTNGIIALVAVSLAFLSIIYGVWSFFKIRKLITIVALTHIPNQTHAFPTPHPNLSFRYTNSPAETDSHITVFEHIYTSFNTPWPYVTLSVITTLFICYLAKRLWNKFKRSHKTTLHMELTTGSECILINLATLPLCPDNWYIQPPTDIHNITIHRSCLFWTTLTLEAPDFSIQNVHTNKYINISTTINISPLKARRLRSLLSQPYTAYFLLAHHQYFKIIQ